MIRTTLLATIASAALAAPALAQPVSAPATPAFIRTAAQTDEFERREGRLAERRAADPRVRDFGAMMVTDHTKTTQALEAALRRAHIPVPPPPALSDDQAHDIAALDALHGHAFDHAYVDQQIQAHQTALGVMQAYANNGDNAVLRKAAADTVPIVQHHLAMANGLKTAP